MSANRRCKIEGCEGNYYAKGFCVKHYHRDRLDRLKEERRKAVRETAAANEPAVTGQAPTVLQRPATTIRQTGLRSTGIVRELDQLGRIVLPIEMRRMLGIEVSDSLEIFVDEDRIVLQKYARGCLFCGKFDDIVYFKTKFVCKACIDEIASGLDSAQ